jgi:hypothetical protein
MGSRSRAENVEELPPSCSQRVATPRARGISSIQLHYAKEEGLALPATSACPAGGTAFLTGRGLRENPLEFTENWRSFEEPMAR